MNENVIANATFRILNLNCRGREMIRENNTRFNNTKGEQVHKVIMWHWRTVILEKSCRLVLQVKNILLLKSPTVRRNCAELTDINNEEIIYTLLNIYKYRYKRK